MPLHKNYDKLMNSKNADMQNINYVGGAGSTTAAQFLQRFILKNTPWAHLDIAGMAFSKYGGALNYLCYRIWCKTIKSINRRKL